MIRSVRYFTVTLRKKQLTLHWSLSFKNNSVLMFYPKRKEATAVPQSDWLILDFLFASTQYVISISGHTDIAEVHLHTSYTNSVSNSNLQIFG